jgi:hypothetical protein
MVETAADAGPALCNIWRRGAVIVLHKAAVDGAGDRHSEAHQTGASLSGRYV